MGLPEFLPSFGGTLLPLSWPVPTAWLSRLLVFLGLFAGVLSSRFQCLLIAQGGCGWLSALCGLAEVGVTLVFGRGLSTCPREAVVPLGSSVLRY